MNAEEAAEGHLSIAAAGLTEIGSVLPDHCSRPAALHSLSLHGNEITSLRGLDAFHGLRSLTLSANAITAISGLQALEALTALDLSSNRLHSLAGLQGLTQLQRLSVAHNFLTSLHGLQDGPARSLVFLNARNNQLAELDVLADLATCSCLRELVLSGGTPGNCVERAPDLRSAAAFALPQLRMLDGHSLEPDRAKHSVLPQQLAAMRLAAFQQQPGPAWQGSPAAASQQGPPALPSSPCCRETVDAVVARLTPWLSRLDQPLAQPQQQPAQKPDSRLQTPPSQAARCPGSPEHGPGHAVDSQHPGRRRMQSTASQCSKRMAPLVSCSVQTAPDPAVTALRQAEEQCCRLQERLRQQDAQLSHAAAAQDGLQQEAARTQGAVTLLEQQV